MARYFFDLRVGGYERDDDGIDLPDDEGAQLEAIRFAGEVLKHEPSRLEEGPIEVQLKNEKGSILFVVEVNLSRAIT